MDQTGLRASNVKFSIQMQANPVQGMSESNSGLGAIQGQWAASKTGVEINNGIETVYQCHCLVTGRRVRGSCMDMDVYIPITTWATKEEVERRRSTL